MMDFETGVSSAESFLTIAATHLLCPGSEFPVHILYELMSLRRRLHHLFQSASAVRQRKKNLCHCRPKRNDTTVNFPGMMQPPFSLSVVQMSKCQVCSGTNQRHFVRPDVFLVFVDKSVRVIVKMLGCSGVLHHSRTSIKSESVTDAQTKQIENDP